MDVPKSNELWELVGIVSGPEPQRTLFEQEIISIAKRENLITLIVRGLPINKGYISNIENITLCAHLDSKTLASALVNAKYIICRSGYSTIMDLLALRKSALLVPTPGQTEQHYLSEHFNGIGIFRTCMQDKLKSITRKDIEVSRWPLPEGIQYPFFNQHSNIYFCK